MPISFIVFFLILCVLILIHEAGHFFAAKKSGVKVHEFGLGLPPKLYGKKIGETEYTLNALPIGGFVRIEGEDPTETGDKEHNFQFKKPKIRLFILLAGIFMNFVTAVILFYVYFIFNGFLSSPIVDFGSNSSFVGANTMRLQTVVSGFANDKNSKNLESGDVIYNATSPSGRNLTISKSGDLAFLTKKDYIQESSKLTLSSFQDFIKQEVGTYELSIYNLQNEKSVKKQVQVYYDDIAKRNVIGVYLSSVIFLDYGQNIIPKFLSGFTHSFNVLNYSTQTLAKIISHSFVQKDISAVSESVSGPVGIYSVINSLLVSKSSNIFWILVDITAIISLSLGFMNLLPIPALDGGRSVFVLFEMIFRKKISPIVESYIHKGGMAFLLLLFALVTIKDVVKLF